LHQQGSYVDATMLRGVWRQPAARLLELTFGADSPATAGLVPGDRDVHQPLHEIPLGRLGGAPRVLQFLVGREEFARANQFQAALERLRAQIETLTSPPSTFTS
jgi:hypothetical protein